MIGIYKPKPQLTWKQEGNNKVAYIGTERKLTIDEKFRIHFGFMSTRPYPSEEEAVNVALTFLKIEE